MMHKRLIKSLEQSVAIIKNIMESKNTIAGMAEEEVQGLYYRLALLRIDADLLEERINETIKRPTKNSDDQYMVLGGVYKDTTFTEVLGDLEEYGPFDTFEEARAIWLGKSFQDVDNCHARYTIERVSEDD